MRLTCCSQPVKAMALEGLKDGLHLEVQSYEIARSDAENLLDKVRR